MIKKKLIKKKIKVNNLSYSLIGSRNDRISLLTNQHVRTSCEVTVMSTQRGVWISFAIASGIN